MQISSVFFDKIVCELYMKSNIYKDLKADEYINKIQLSLRKQHTRITQKKKLQFRLNYSTNYTITQSKAYKFLYSPHYRPLYSPEYRLNYSPVYKLKYSPNYGLNYNQNIDKTID